MMQKERKVMMKTPGTRHKRLDHTFISKLDSVGLIKYVSLKGFCDSCNKAKFARRPFPVSKTKTYACFDLIHCDVWGKY